MARLTYHSGYRSKKTGRAYNSKHNDRENFEKGKPAQGNIYCNFVQDDFGGTTFAESEQEFYKSAFGPYLDAANLKAKKKGNPLKTVAGYHEKHPPEEVLLYIGKGQVDRRLLCQIFDDYAGWLGSLTDDMRGGVQLLNAALHTDEDSDHIHFRQVWWYGDKDGNAQVSQNKALAVMGFRRPDPTKPESRYNNAKMAFTAASREKLMAIARGYGLELETEPLPKEESGLALDEHIKREQAREAHRAEMAVIRQETEAAISERDAARDGARKAREEQQVEAEKVLKLKSARQGLQNALQGDLRTVEVQEARHGATALLAALGASVRPPVALDADRRKAVRDGIESAMERVKRMNRANEARWAASGPITVDGPEV